MRLTMSGTITGLDAAIKAKNISDIQGELLALPREQVVMGMKKVHNTLALTHANDIGPIFGLLLIQHPNIMQEIQPQTLSDTVFLKWLQGMERVLFPEPAHKTIPHSEKDPKKSVESEKDPKKSVEIVKNLLKRREVEKAAALLSDPKILEAAKVEAIRIAAEPFAKDKLSDKVFSKYILNYIAAKERHRPAPKM